MRPLKIKNMVRNHHLARVISDMAWGGLIAKLICKAAEADGRVIKVNPRHTSQMCSNCCDWKHLLSQNDSGCFQ